MSLRSLFFRRSSEPQTFEIAFDQAVYEVRVRRLRRARRYTLRVQAASRNVVLTMPLRGNLREAKSFVLKHGAWIAARLARLPEAAPFGDGMIVPLRGEPHRIAHRPKERGTVWLEMGSGGEQLICVAGQAPHVGRRVRDYLKREAKRELEAASRSAAQKLDVTIKRISVRDQASRWGSCSSTGVLSYSWRLIMAPSFVLDYLAVHEVAHLREMNHSPRFWRLVSAHCPDVARAKAWLEAHGSDLHRYGVADDEAKPHSAIIR